MKGRIFGIKKTTVLKLSFVVTSTIFLLCSALSERLLSIPNLWFYSFLIATGIYLIIKSALFRLDSACFFGSLLLIMGVSYLYCYFLKILNFYSVFVLLSFSLASLFSGYFFKQNFQYLLSFSLFFIAIFCFLFLLNIISLWIFLAIIGLCVLLLVVAYVLN